MKIAQVITGLPKAAGTTTFVENVTTALKELGHDVKIVTLGDLEQFWAGEPPDVVHIHALWSRMLHQVAAWARLKNVPVVWSTHGMTAPWALHHKWWKKCLPWYLVQRRDLQRAAKIHCTTELEEGWNRALGFERTFVVPLGTGIQGVEKSLKFDVSGLRLGEEKGERDGRVEVERCREESDVRGLRLGGQVPVAGGEDGRVEGERCREEFDVRGLRFEGGKRVLLYVGRIYPVKALDNLIKAFALAKETYGQGLQTSNSKHQHVSHWKLRLVGPDQAGHLAELKALCEQLGVVEDVEFVGPKFDAELEAEYARCDTLALVSHTENFGATVVDAMAHGKPVVTSTKTPWKVVADEQCGWWVDNAPERLAEALTELFSASVSDLERMGQSGRALVERDYTWQAVARKLEAVYENLKR